MTNPVYARGVAKIVTIAPETTFGVASTAVGQQLRRITSDLNVTVTPIQSQEILPSQQVRDVRHGPQQVSGTISGQLSCQTYNLLFKALMRSNFSAGATTSTAMTDLTATISGTTLTVDSTTTNFLTLGFLLGDMVQFTGLTSTAAVNNSTNFKIIALAANAMTLQSLYITPVGWTTGQSVQMHTVGYKLFMPASGQLDPSFTLEHWFSDAQEGDLFTGVKVSQISLNIPASGFVTIQASLIGQQGISETTQAYPSATAPNTNTSLTAVAGYIIYKGATIAIVTGASMQIAATAQADPVVGSNIVPAIFMGTLSARGSLTALFPSGDTMQQDFLLENEVDLSFVFTSAPSGTANFVSFYLPRVKLMSATKSDSDRAITRSFQFMALENAGQYPAANLTTLVMQDALQTTA